MRLRTLVLIGAAATALAACDQQPCQDPDGCGPIAEPGALVLTHGGLVVAGGEMVDETHDADGVLSMGHIKSRSGDLRLVGTLTD